MQIIKTLIIYKLFIIYDLKLIHVNIFFCSKSEDHVSIEEVEEEVDGKVYPAEYYHTERGNYLRVNGFYFLRNTVSQNTMSWRCTLYRSFKCRARAKTDFSRPDEATLGVAHHTHARDDQRSIRRQKLIRKELTKQL